MAIIKSNAAKMAIVTKEYEITVMTEKKNIVMEMKMKIRRDEMRRHDTTQQTKIFKDETNSYNRTHTHTHIFIFRKTISSDSGNDSDTAQ